MTEIIQQLQNIISVGDEKAVRQFIVEHIKEFPVQIRNKFIFAFFREAVARETEIKVVQAKMVSEAKPELKELRKIGQNIEEKKRIVELHQKINKE